MLKKYVIQYYDCKTWNDLVFSFNGKKEASIIFHEINDTVYYYRLILRKTKKDHILLWK